MEKARDYVAQFRKPVIFDECKYEGNIPKRWGNISAQEMVRRFWLATVSGAYVGHGETYLDPNDSVVVEGRSAARPESRAHRVPAQDPGSRPGRRAE